jgi:pimeloyl-ACP methyl ester carboxylesterase
MTSAGEAILWTVSTSPGGPDYRAAARDTTLRTRPFHWKTHRRTLGCRVPSDSRLVVSAMNRIVVACVVSVTVAAGCATSPIGVRRMNPDAVSRAITANALTENKPSIDSCNVLQRRGLFERFRKSPAWTLAELHRIAVHEDDNDTWFALAELSFIHADRTDNRKYSLMAAIYAWSFLFGGDEPDPFDPRLRVAADLYNRGLTQGLEQSYERGLILSDGIVDLPIGRITIDFDPSVLMWNGRKLHNFIPVAELEVTGLNNRFRTPGIGAPLAASAAAADPNDPNEFLVPRLKTPITAVVRFDDVRAQIRKGEFHAVLELHTDPNEQSIEIAGREVPLEKEPSAALAAMVAEAPVIKSEILAFFGSAMQTMDKGRLVALRPHKRGRIPVVFVHGTASSPARWAEMVNVLDNDPRINEHYEPWFFSYNSSSPIAYSSYLLRSALVRAVNTLDPDGTDRDLRRMIVIGHSQGGLLTKMTAVNSGDHFWKSISDKPFENVRLDDEDKETLRAALFVEPLPFVSRVIFLCTPHRGSFLATKDWVRGLITRMVSLPMRFTKLSVSLVTMNPDLASLGNLQRTNAVDNMTPGNRFIQTLVTIPVDERIAANSIIAVSPDFDPYEDGNDGVVEYKSAHIEGVESEKVVRTFHSSQAFPETIEEVRRILLHHNAVAEPAPGPKVSPAVARQM